MSDALTTPDLADDALLERLKELVRQAIEPRHQSSLNFAEVNAATPLLSLPMDSLALMELMAGIEETFEVYIPEEQAFAFLTVGDVITYIQTKTLAKQQRTAPSSVV